MTGVATATIVGGALISDREQDRADRRASNQRPQFARAVEPSINRQIQRVQNTSVQPFGGDRVAGFNDSQTRGFEGVPDLFNILQDQAGLSAAGFGDIASGSRIGQNPFLDAALQAGRDTAFTDLSRNQLPAIRNQAVATGGIGGSRQGIAEGLAVSDLNRDLAQVDAQARASQVNVDQGQQLQALINQSQILSGQDAPQNLLFQTGALQQGQEQAEIDANRQLFEEQQNLQFNRDQELLRILLGTPAGVPPLAQQTSPLSAGLGTALAFDQLFGGNPSTNVNVGTQPSGAGTRGTFDFVNNQRGFVGGF